MRGWVALLALSLASASARADELPVALFSRDHPALRERIALELGALGHAVSLDVVPSTPAARVRILSSAAVLYALIETPGRAALTIALRVDGPGGLSASALRVVEALRAALIERAPVGPPPTAGPRAATWYDSLHVAAALGVTCTPEVEAAVPSVHLRLAWERLPWIEAVATIGLTDVRFGSDARLGVSSLALGLGAPLAHGRRGAIGVTLRGGLSWISAVGDLSTSGVVGIAEGAVTSRLTLWGRFALYSSLSVGSTLAAVIVRSGAGASVEWGRPYLHGAIGLSY